MSESITRESISLTGLPGATFNGRFVGTVSGAAPTTGTFLAGDFVIDQTGFTWVCTTAGSPGTWVKTGTPFTGGTVGNLTVSGSLTVSGTTIISGANTIYGSTNLSGTNTFNGGTFYNSPLFNTSTTYSGNVTVGSGNLTVTSGTTTLSGTQNLYGNTLLNGTNNIQGTNVIGNPTASGGLTVSGTTTLSGALSIYSPTVGGIAVFSGAVMTYNNTQWIVASGASGGAGNMILIATSNQSSTTSSFSFTGIPSTYNHLKLIFTANNTGNSGFTAFNVAVNAISTTNYTTSFMNSGGFALTNGTTGWNMNYFPSYLSYYSLMTGELLFSNYSGTSKNPSYNTRTMVGTLIGGSSANISIFGGHCQMSTSTTAINTITISTSTGYIFGSFYLYGIT